MVMMLVVTGVGMLIHLFSVGYMRDDPGYPRYFAYLNLFVFFMLVLVLGANYPMLFIGWEGVGLCSYLLIGFWFSEKANADAGKKAFIVNRIGDFGFLIAMFLLFANFGTLDFSRCAGAVGGSSSFGRRARHGHLPLLLPRLRRQERADSALHLAPRRDGRPDARVGADPRRHDGDGGRVPDRAQQLPVRAGARWPRLTVVAVGALTALFAATIGLKQWDIKKVLAYSTVSQLGYMFVGVGAGAYVAGIFHLMTHAFFKALLFLGSGSVIHAMHAGVSPHAQPRRRAGHAQHGRPASSTCRSPAILMWIATLAIAGIPPFSGFFSKDEILGTVFARAQGSRRSPRRSWLGMPGTAVLYVAYALGLAAALLTAIYMTRMMLYTFHGPNRTGREGARAPARSAVDHDRAARRARHPRRGRRLVQPAGDHHPRDSAGARRPAGTLARARGRRPALRGVIGTGAANGRRVPKDMLIAVAVAIAIAGIATAVVVLKPAALVPKSQASPRRASSACSRNKYYVDEIYDATVVEPVVGGLAQCALARHRRRADRRTLS